MSAKDDHDVTANAGEPLKLDRPTVLGLGDDGVVPVADRPPLFKDAGEYDLEIGTDGDDIGAPAYEQAIGDMLNSGHGFQVRRIEKPKTKWRATCEVCDGPLPTPGDDPDWLCQYYDETRPASPTCNCAWCLKYQDYLAGRYKPQGGRPRQRCGAKECDRKADSQRKARRRNEARRKRLVAESVDTIGELPTPTRADTEAALSNVDQLPDEIRSGVTSKLRQRLASFDGYQAPVWNRRRGRNEPKWQLHCQRKREAARVSEKPPNW